MLNVPCCRPPVVPFGLLASARAPPRLFPACSLVARPTALTHAAASSIFRRVRGSPVDDPSGLRCRCARSFRVHSLHKHVVESVERGLAGRPGTRSAHSRNCQRYQPRLQRQQNFRHRHPTHHLLHASCFTAPSRLHIRLYLGSRVGAITQSGLRRIALHGQPPPPHLSFAQQQPPQPYQGHPSKRRGAVGRIPWQPQHDVPRCPTMSHTACESPGGACTNQNWCRDMSTPACSCNTSRSAPATSQFQKWCSLAPAVITTPHGHGFARPAAACAAIIPKPVTPLTARRQRGSLCRGSHTKAHSRASVHRRDVKASASGAAPP